MPLTGFMLSIYSGYFHSAFAVKNAADISTPVCAASEQSLAPSSRNSPLSRRNEALSAR